MEHPDENEKKGHKSKKEKHEAAGEEGLANAKEKKKHHHKSEGSLAASQTKDAGGHHGKASKKKDKLKHLQGFHSPELNLGLVQSLGSPDTDKFLPLIYDPRKKVDTEKPASLPPKPLEPRKDEPPKKVERPKRDGPQKREEPKPLGDFSEMIEKLTTQIDVLLGKSVNPLDEKEHISKHEDSAFLKLENFAIPQQEKLLQLLYSSGNETRPCHFGGNMFAYYSNVLRCFTPINMQGRYRGQGLFAKSMTAIDVSKVGLKSEETMENIERKDDMLERETDAFASVAVDDEHYLFLRQLWNFHPSSLPVSVTYENLFLMVPIMEDMFLTYSRRIGKNHPVTLEAKKRYEALKQKLESYLKLLLEPLPLLQKRDPRFVMNEEELLDTVITDYGPTDETFEIFRDRKSQECLVIKEKQYHDLLQETLQYRQELESDRFQLYLDKD